MRNSLTILNQTLNKTQQEDGLDQGSLESRMVQARKISQYQREIKLEMSVVLLWVSVLIVIQVFNSLFICD